MGSVRFFSRASKTFCSRVVHSYSSACRWNRLGRRFERPRMAISRTASTADARPTNRVSKITPVNHYSPGPSAKPLTPVISASVETNYDMAVNSVIGSTWIYQIYRLAEFCREIRVRHLSETPLPRAIRSLIW